MIDKLKARVKCAECGQPLWLSEAPIHALHTQHYQFRFTRDVEIPVRVKMAKVIERAIR